MHFLELICTQRSQSEENGSDVVEEAELKIPGSRNDTIVVAEAFRDQFKKIFNKKKAKQWAAALEKETKVGSRTWEQKAELEAENQYRLKHNLKVGRLEWKDGMFAPTLEDFVTNKCETIGSLPLCAFIQDGRTTTPEILSECVFKGEVFISEPLSNNKSNLAGAVECLSIANNKKLCHYNLEGQLMTTRVKGVGKDLKTMEATKLKGAPVEVVNGRLVNPQQPTKENARVGDVVCKHCYCFEKGSLKCCQVIGRVKIFFCCEKDDEEGVKRIGLMFTELYPHDRCVNQIFED